MLKPRTLILSGLLILGGTLLVSGATSRAVTLTSFSIESIGGQVGLGNADLREVILNVIRWALGVLSLVAVSYMIYGGYIWLTSGGNEQRIEKAKQIILQAAIGMVIVLLAWAIVFFVAKIFANVTTNSGGAVACGLPPNPPCGCALICPAGTPPTFDIVAVNTCAAPPVWDNVPRTSAVSFTFNNHLRKVPSGSPVATTPYVLANDPIKKAIDPPAKNLILQHCKNQDVTCGSGFEPVPTPATMTNQVYTSGNTTAGTDAVPLSEWLAIQNTLTFYHLSSTLPADNNMFKANEVYRVIIPITTTNNGLRDIYDDAGRVLAFCRSNPNSLVNDIDHCDFDAGNNNLLYTFKVGTDLDGTPIKVTGATPSDEYRRVPAVGINRNVSRDTPMAIFFNGGVDPISITTTNFELHELSVAPTLVAGPNYGLCGGAECGGTQVDPADLKAAPYMGNGATLSYIDGRWLKPYTWYKVKVKDFRNLCGTTMDPNPYYWLFETNAVTPGVDFVYPTSGTNYSCPNTQVFAQFNSSMLNPNFGANTCGVNGAFSPDLPGKSIRASYETHAALWNGAGTVAGNWKFTDEPLAGDTDLSDNCRQLAFTPAAQLAPTQTYSGLVIANRFIDTDGHTLTYGDRPPPGGLPTWDKPVSPALQKPWNFQVAPANSCVQQPIVTQVYLDHDANGACVSVLGAYFEKPTELISNGLPEPGDQLALGEYPAGTEAIQPAAAVKSWSGSTIVNKLDKGTLVDDQDYNFKVSVNYPAPIGLLASPVPTLASRFHLDPGVALPTRPCLYNVSPNAGFPGVTIFDANGENFGVGGGSSRFASDNPLPTSTWNYAPGGWSSNQISQVKVLSTAIPTPLPLPPAKVWVVNASNVPSNKVNFNVMSPVITPVGTPVLITELACSPAANIIPSPNPKNGDLQACRNTKIQARFSLNIDAASASTSVLLDLCPVAGCAGGPYVNVVGPSAAVGQIVTFTPGADLDKNRWYRVTIKNTLKADAAAGGKNILSDIVWTFQTINSDDLCQVDNVVLAPPGPMMTNQANYGAVGLTATPIDTACHVLTSSSLTFDWTETNTAVGTLQPTPITGTTNVKSLTQPGAGVVSPVAITTSITATTQSKISPAFDFTYNPIGCAVSADCSTNGHGEACGAPACLSGVCQPVLNSIERTAGNLGSFVTFKGCWFGGYVAGQSTVKFISDKEGKIPDPVLCGNDLWNNDRIIREVPDQATVVTTDDASTGPVKVIRFDSQVADGPSHVPPLVIDFTVNPAINYPNLCKINPNNGLVGSGALATLSGSDFGSPKNALDKVTFKKTPSGPAADVTDYPLPFPALPQWNNDSINITVPAATTLGYNDVTVTRGPEISNPVDYNALASAGPVCLASSKLCHFGIDAECQSPGPGFDATWACSYPVAGGFGMGCCAKKPKAISFKPNQGDTNICLNTIAQITFDQPLDSSTITAGPTGTVQYQDGVRIVNGSAGYRTTVAQEGEISYYPGLLHPGPQTMSLASYEPVPALFSVLNPSFESATLGVPNNWTASRAKQSSIELPPGHTGFSVLADCTVGSGCTAIPNQSDAHQNVSNFGGTHDLNASYRITGWVKVIMDDTHGGTNRAGLITRCSSSGSQCPYDLTNSTDLTPGLFKTSSNGWQFLDFVVTNTAKPPTQPNTNEDIHLLCFANFEAKTWCDDITVTKVSSQPTVIRGANGVLADPAGTPLKFTTGPSICTVDRVEVVAANTNFTSLTPPPPDPKLTGSTYSNIQSAPITTVPDYQWTWAWSSQSPAVVTAAIQTNSSTTTALLTPVARGNTTVTAKATISVDNFSIPTTKDRTIDGQANVNVNICDLPWGMTDSAGNCDVGACNGYNFSLSYCRDNGATPLPDFSYPGTGGGLGSIEGITAADPTRLKSYFFKVSAVTRDTIGLLIFKNDEFLSPYDWFKKRFPLDTAGSSTIIDGYPAVKSGTTTYIGVTNYRSDTSPLQGLMFVFDYNSNNADPETVQIANQMINSIIFNLTLTVAKSDQLLRDTRRRQDMTSIKLLLNTYRTKHGTYPDLAAGSYITGFSTSKWPSWQTTLGSDLTATLPSDPNNTFSSACVPPLDGTSCWSETDKKFTCPNGSKIYAYKYGVASANLYATMEFGAGTTATFISPPAGGICASPSSCDCFNFTLPVTP